MFSPALPSHSRIRAVLRYVLTLGASIATALVLVELPGASETISSYSRYQHDVLTARGAGDFQFGLKVFPDLRAAPPPIAIDNDFQLTDSLGVDGISIVVDPEGARGKALDSLVHSLDNVRDDSTVLIVTLGYPRGARAALDRSPTWMTGWPTSIVSRVHSGRASSCRRTSPMAKVRERWECEHRLTGSIS
jgi:hypothetical protein